MTQFLREVCFALLCFAFLLLRSLRLSSQHHFGTPQCVELRLHCPCPSVFRPIECFFSEDLHLFVCSFFLLWRRRHVSLTFLPGLKATRKECRLADLLNCSDNPFKYAWYGQDSATFLIFLFSFVCVLRSLFHKSSHGLSARYQFATNTSSMLCSSSARCLSSHKALALPAKPFY